MICDQLGWIWLHEFRKPVVTMGRGAKCLPLRIWILNATSAKRRERRGVWGFRIESMFCQLGEFVGLGLTSFFWGICLLEQQLSSALYAATYQELC